VGVIVFWQKRQGSPSGEGGCLVISVGDFIPVQVKHSIYLSHLNFPYRLHC
jgi:hypothetical protein